MNLNCFGLSYSCCRDWLSQWFRVYTSSNPIYEIIQYRNEKKKIVWWNSILFFISFVEWENRIFRHCELGNVSDVGSMGGRNMITMKICGSWSKNEMLNVNRSICVLFPRFFFLSCNFVSISNFPLPSHKSPCAPTRHSFLQVFFLFPLP